MLTRLLRWLDRRRCRKCRMAAICLTQVKKEVGVKVLDKVDGWERANKCCPAAHERQEFRALLHSHEVQEVLRKAREEVHSARELVRRLQDEAQRWHDIACSQEDPRRRELYYMPPGERRYHEERRYREEQYYRQQMQPIPPIKLPEGGKSK